MKKTKQIVFGKRPILMQRWDGGIRIISPNGRVQWCTFGCQELNARFKACTTRTTQREAYNACVEYDDTELAPGECNMSAFLGYL